MRKVGLEFCGIELNEIGKSEAVKIARPPPGTRTVATVRLASSVMFSKSTLPALDRRRVFRKRSGLTADTPTGNSSPFWKTNRNSVPAWVTNFSGIRYRSCASAGVAAAIKVNKIEGMERSFMEMSFSGTAERGPPAIGYRRSR